ncbi:hypothetical protein Noda2021_11000 [Candidatus Dependentiae bacterium Noda2021]|nr:hypothetical protein Noda2021_11000 [Candidatus Dependentiae bacterium Noda2021]
MKIIKYFFALVGFATYSLSFSMAPSQLSALQQEFKQVLAAQNFDRAREIVDKLEGAGARAIALPLRVQLEEAIKNYAVDFGADIGQELTDVKRDLRLQKEQVRKDLVLIEQLRKELKAVQAESIALQQEFNRLQKDFTADINERNRIEKELRDLNAQLRNQNNTLTRDIESVQQEAADRVATVSRQLRDNTDQLNAMRLERDRLQVLLDTKIRTATTTQQDLQKRFDALDAQSKKEIADLRAQHQVALKEAQDRNNELQDQLRSASAGEPVLVKENERLTAVNANITQQITQLQKDVTQARVQATAAEQSHATALQAEQQRRATAEANLANAQAQVKLLQQDIIQAQGLVAARDAQITQLNNSLKEQFNIVDQAQQNAQERLAQAELKSDELRKEIATLQQNLARSEQGEPVLALENQRLITQIDSLNKQLKDKQDRYDSAANEIERMRKLKNDAIFKRADMDKELKVAQQQLQQLQKTAADNRAQLQQTINTLEDQLRATHAQKQQDIANLEEQFNKKLSSLTQNNNVEIRKLNERLQNYANKVKELTLQLDKVQEVPVEKFNQQIVDLQNQLNNMRNFFQERFLPNISGMMPAVTLQDTNQLQEKIDNIITIINKLSSK